MTMTDKNYPGLYIHVPFCAGKCPYCDFYSINRNRDLINKYTEKVISDLKKCNSEFNTVYFGGGTPSALPPENISSIIDNINIIQGAEITVECNPSDTGGKDSDYDFSVLSKSGVNRVSLGLQSAVESERKDLGRKAGTDEVKRAIERIFKSGIENISLDLMLGIPGQTAESLNKSVDFCIDSGAKHISAYILKIEENTYFGKHREKYDFPSDDLSADFYLLASERLKQSGFTHYEISNFALPGYESRHNLKYWKLEEYLGIGPSAHSFIGGKRFFYPPDLHYYLSGVKPSEDGPGGNAEEYIMLSLRINDGMDLSVLKNKYKITSVGNISDKCADFSSMGYGYFYNNIFSLNEKGFLISNYIINEICSLL